MVLQFLQRIHFITAVTLSRVCKIPIEGSGSDDEKVKGDGVSAVKTSLPLGHSYF